MANLVCPFEKDPTLAQRVDRALDNRLCLVLISPQAYQARPGVVAHPPVERSRMMLTAALGKIGLQGLTPLCWPLTSGSDYLIPMLPPEGHCTLDIYDTYHSHLLCLIELARRIDADLRKNAALDQSLPIELVLQNPGEVDLARALARISAEMGALYVESQDNGRIPVPLPDPRTIATPPLLEKPKNLCEIAIVGVEVGPDTRHTLMLRNGVRLRLTTSPDAARQMLWPEQCVSGTAVHDGQDWSLDQIGVWRIDPAKELTLL